MAMTAPMRGDSGREVFTLDRAASGWQSDADFDDKVRLMEQWRREYGPPPLAAPRT
jgi:hypothetical protein